MGNLTQKLRLFGVALVVVFLTAASALTVHAEEYRLGVQDRLRIQVTEWPALNGEVSVGPSGNISLPMLGQIRAADLDTAELAENIATRLKEIGQLSDLPDTSVDIIGYRPFYILGSVTTPGEYEYRPGMIVLNALSIAGGAFRSDRFSAWDAERVAITSHGDIAVLTLRLQDLQAEKIRLTAELDDASDFPPHPANADAQLIRALEEQRRIFDGRQDRRRLAKAALDGSIASREQEIASLEKQMADVARKRLTTEDEVRRVQKLVEQQLAVHRLAPLERTLADILREQQELEIRRLGAEQGIRDQQRELLSIDEARRTEVVADVQRVDAQTREVEEQRLAALRLLGGAAQYSTTAIKDDSDNDEPELRFMIVRTKDGEVSEIDASEMTRVLPGDIVRVFRVSELPVTGAVRSSQSDASRQ